MSHNVSNTKETGNTSLGISIGCFVYSMVALLYSALSTTAPLGVIQYLSMAGLAATVLIAPALGSFHLSRRRGEHWYTSDGILTIACLFIVFLAGFAGIIGGNILVAVIGAGVIALSLPCFMRSKGVFIRIIIVSLACGLFFVRFFFSQGYHSPHFTENVIQGIAHIDTLYHSAIANLSSTYHTITSGVHGTPTLKYHVGSHVLIGGISKLIHLSVVDFYNTGYAVVFVPLYFKSFFLLTFSLSKKEDSCRAAVLPIASVLLVLIYSTGHAILGSMHPLVSESNAVSITLSFLLLAGIAQSSETKKTRRSTLSLYLFSLITILWITATKISVGCVVFGTLSYLLLRTERSFKAIITILASAAFCWVLLIVGFIYNTSRPSVNMDLSNRYMNFWELSGGLVGYTLGFLIAGVVIASHRGQSNGKGIISLIKERRLLDCELLCIATFLGLMGGAIASSNRSDAAYFASIQLYPSFALATAALLPLSKDLMKSKWTPTVACSLIALLALISTPKIQQSHLNMTAMHKNTGTGNAPLRQLIGHLDEINAEREKNKKFIYIPLDQQWLYSSQRGTPLGVFFIIPAYSGVASLSGFPPSLANQHRYSFPLYKNAPPPLNFEQAKQEAINREAHELITFYLENGSLVRKDVQLPLMN